ncbi:MAG TPA: nitrogen fixation protein NifZ [Azospira sp.]|nr:nitrogen fixation protein NifZ [Azospira sp.]
MPNYLNIGDIVFALEPIRNDGGVPDLVADALLATSGARGLVVQIGAAVADLSQEIILVRFEDAAGVLGPPVGCLPDELTQDQARAGERVPA